MKHGWYHNTHERHLFGLFINGKHIGNMNNQGAPGEVYRGIVFDYPIFPSDLNYKDFASGAINDFRRLLGVKNGQILEPGSILPIPFWIPHFEEVNESHYEFYWRIDSPQNNPDIDIWDDIEIPTNNLHRLTSHIELNTHIAVKIGTFPWAMQKLIEGHRVTRRSARIKYINTPQAIYSWYLVPGHTKLSADLREDDLIADDWVIYEL